MLNPKDVKYFKNGFEENKKFWKRLNIFPSFKNKLVLDFGCGHGAMCVDIAKRKVNKILGIDKNTKLINFAKKNITYNFNTLKKKIFFHKNLYNINLTKKFDYIISKDTFEHTVGLKKVLDFFFKILKKNGKVFIGFGPVYYFYNGDHGRTNSFFPWGHLVLPKNFLFYNKAKKIEELGLNGYSHEKYIEIIKNSKFQIEYLKENKSDHSIFLLINLLRKINFLKKILTNNLYIILKK